MGIGGFRNSRKPPVKIAGNGIGTSIIPGIGALAMQIVDSIVSETEGRPARE